MESAVFLLLLPNTGQSVLTVAAGHRMSVDILRLPDGAQAQIKAQAFDESVQAALRKPGTYRFRFKIMSGDHIVAQRSVIYRRNSDDDVIWKIE